MSLVGDMVLQTANSPSTGTFQLIAPPSGRSSLIFANGPGPIYYYAHDGTNWEKGVGTVTGGSPDTLSRDTVVRNSSGGTSKVNFSGTVTILTDVLSERVICASADNASVAFGNRVAAGLVAGSSPDHAPRYDQIGDVRVFTYTVSGGNIVVPVPSDPVEIQFGGLVSGSALPMFFRVSTNGGASYLSGATEYANQLHSQVGATITGSASSSSFVAMGFQNVATNYGAFGNIKLYPANFVFRGEIQSNNGSNLTSERFSGNWSTASAPSHILISAVGGTLTGGYARLVKRPL